MFAALCFRLADISVTPDFNGLPPSLRTGLTHLADNMAAVLVLVAAIGIVSSLIGMVIGHAFHSERLAQTSLKGLFASVGSGALLIVAVLAANYAVGLFR